ncbi:MAG: DUF4430 domain-containing protein [Ruminiclostridium sp.]
MKKLWAVFAALFIIVFTLAAPVSAESSTLSAAEKAVLWVKAQYGTKGDSPLINSAFCENAGKPEGDWYVIALKKLGLEDNYGDYLSALTDYISGKYAEGTENSLNPTDYYRMIIAIKACGGDPCNVGGTDLVADRIFCLENPAKQGINGWIWALIALDSGDYPQPDDALNTKEKIIDEILAKQLPDGGFAMTGTKADPDVTAMALQALAPYYYKEGFENVTAAIEKAVDCLSKIQLQNGGYSSWGVENSESASQVVISLCSLGISPEDSGFTKDKSLFAELLSYQLSDGGFAHIKGDEKGADITARQALLALTAVQLLEKGERLYDFSADGTAESGTDNSDGTANNAEISDETAARISENITPDYRPIIAVCVSAVLLIALAAVIGVSVKKQLGKRSILTGIIVIMVLGFISGWLIYGVKYQSVEDYYLEHIDDITEDSETVFLSINCSTVLDNLESLDKGLERYVGNGEILPKTEYVLREKDTAYDLLLRAVRYNKIQLEHKENGYIMGINYLYEFSCGELSGWMYRVNGEFPTVSCADYVLSDGDYVEWVYTCDLGRDVGDNYYMEAQVE